MLRNTFIHVPGIGKVRERWLWRRGFHEWIDVIEGERPEEWSQERWDDLVWHLESSEAALGRRDAQWFESRLSVSDSWRMYEEFACDAAYIDIETSGAGRMHEQVVTVIGVYDGAELRQFIHGKNTGDFIEFIKRFKLLVTYNGKAFDIPMLHSRWAGARLDRVGHIDLRYVYAAMGFKGGLKGIEKALGIERPDGVDGMDGYAAVICWQRYLKGRQKYLDVLLKYNAEDVRNLKPLAEMACLMARQRLLSGFRRVEPGIAGAEEESCGESDG